MGEETAAIRKELLLNAIFYGRELHRDALALMIYELQGCALADIQRAFAEYRDNPMNRTFPLPAAIKALIKPALTGDDESTRAVDRILWAISEFGWARGDEARAELGPIAWDVVQGWGGWSYLCENMGPNINPGVFKKQARESYAVAAKTTRINKQMALNAPEDPKLLGLVKQLVTTNEMGDQ